MRLIPTILAGLVLGASACAADPTSAPWVWLEGVPSGAKAWFRGEVKASEPSTGYVRIVADRKFIAWANGVKLGEGDASRFHRFTLNGIVERGTNVIAVEVEGGADKAGLLVEGQIRGQGGSTSSFTSGPNWKASPTAPTGDSWTKPYVPYTGFKPVRVLGKHTESAWKSLQFVETELDRFSVPPGFELKRVAKAGMTGSLINLAWGSGGRLLVSRERGGIYNLLDDDGDGVYDRATLFSDAVKSCQGLCQVGDYLYAVGDGPKGAGMYRLHDKDRAGKADSVELVTGVRGGIGEHGPHAVVFGPDGNLYFNLGNHSQITHKPEPNSPILKWSEDDLLQPRVEDGGGHAVGVKAPGGTIWRFSPDGKKWWLETAGFRNHYDFAFTQRGDMFTFDSDMEWDVGQSWYRPIRMNHCVPGADFGWRSGAANSPPYFVDNLPTTVDVGRGSPTGVVVYEHKQFPEAYRGAVLLCDWSMGRILVSNPQPKGASFGGGFETLVSGNPLNVSDIEVAPDGSVVFTVGGRNTEGGVYRLTYKGVQAKASKPKTVAEVLALPQPSANWAREWAEAVKKTSGDAWAIELQKAATSASTADLRIRALSLLCQFGHKPSVELLTKAAADADPAVQGFAVWLLGDHPTPAVAKLLAEKLVGPSPVVRRRAAEAFVRSGLEPPVGPLVAMLASNDQWERFAGRLAIERVPVDKWRSSVLNSDSVNARIHGLLALTKAGKIDPQEALSTERALLERELTPEQSVSVARLVQLSLVSGGSGDAAKQVGALLLAKFPTGDEPVDFESARVAAFLQVPGACEKLVAMLTSPKLNQSQQIHYALCLRYLKAGWTPELRATLVKWYEGTRDWEGGNSIAQNLENIFGGTLDVFPPAEVAAALRSFQSHPFAVRAMLKQASVELTGAVASTLEPMLKDLDSPSGAAHRDALLPALLEALDRSPAPEVQKLVRKLYETQPDRRDMLARAMARHPRPENWRYLVDAVRTADDVTAQVCLKALGQLNTKAEKADDYRTVIVAGYKLAGRGGPAAATILQNWTGKQHDAGRDWRKALAVYKGWYKEKFPNAPAAEAPKDDTTKSRYTFAELVSHLDRGEGRSGDVAAGKLVYTKANCIKCHRFGKEGENVGPDLTSVRKRFQRKEIVESVLYPSQVISDQFKSIMVETKSGLTVNGLPLPQSNDKELVLLLSDATKLRIAKSDVEQRQDSKVSVMPEGLFKTLSKKEIADLFAYLETSKDAVEEAKPANK